MPVGVTNLLRQEPYHLREACAWGCTLDGAHATSPSPPLPLTHHHIDCVHGPCNSRTVPGRGCVHSASVIPPNCAWWCSSTAPQLPGTPVCTHALNQVKWEHGHHRCILCFNAKLPRHETLKTTMVSSDGTPYWLMLPHNGACWLRPKYLILGV